MIRPKAKLTPEEIEAKNEDAYEHLLSLIEDTQGQMALILAACDSMAQREQIIKRYEADAWAEEQVRPFRIRLGQEPSLRAGLAALEEEHPYLKEEGKAVVSVTGAELLLRVKITGDEAQTELEKFFGYLQWTREALRAFRYPVVLWVSREILREMSRRAPDFWSWRKAVLRFEAEAGEQSSLPQQAAGRVDRGAERAFQSQVQNGAVSQSAQTQAGPEDAGDLPPLTALLAELEQLEAREPESYGLAALYDKLGQVYAQRVRRGEAMADADAGLAIAAFQKGIERYQAQGHGDAAATALNRLAGVYADQSQFDQALLTAQAALETAQQAGNALEEMIALRRMGHAQYSLGNFSRSIDHHQQSLEVAQAIKDREGEAAALNGLGLAYWSLGQYQRAIAFHQQSLEMKREIGDRRGEANSLESLGVAYQCWGQYQWALYFHQQSLEIEREIGNRSGEARSLGNLGLAYRSLGQYQRAIYFYQQSLEIRREIGDRRGEGASNFSLALAKAKLDEHWAAKQNLEQAKAIYTELKLEDIVEQCDQAIRECNKIIAQQPRRVPPLGDPEPTHLD